MNKKWARSLGIYIGIPIAILIVIFYMYSNKAKTTDKMGYSDIVSKFTQMKVTEFKLDFNNNNLELKVSGEEKPINYKVPNLGIFIEKIDPLIVEYDKANPDKPMKYDYLPKNEMPWFVSLLPTILLLVGIVAFWFFMAKRMGGLGDGKASSFGKAKIRASGDDKRKTTFADVAGADEEKEELKEVVDFLKDKNKYNELGARIPKGILLVGPPGTGKTLLARAVAGEAGVPFFSISGSDFVEMFVGVGASRVRDLFDQAKKSAPCIIFIDEIDAVGRQRGAGFGGGHDEREQTLNQLLVEMDGFGVNEGVIMIAATNRPDILDPALMRPGRFDRQVAVGYPDIKGREAILKVHARGKPFSADVDLNVVAKSTSGFTGADLENLLNESALLAARKSQKAITMVEIEEAKIKVVVGTEKKSRVISEKEKKITAFHEAGHAVASFYLESQDPVHQISIIPTGLAGGYTMNIPTEDKMYATRTQMKEEIVVLLAGRAAEAIVLEDITTGASSDIQRATSIARNMVVKYGMSERLGPVMFGSEQEVFLGRDYGHANDFSEEVASRIDEEISTFVTTAYTKAEEILTSNKSKLNKIAEYLLANEKIDAQKFVSLMGEE